MFDSFAPRGNVHRCRSPFPTSVPAGKLLPVQRSVTQPLGVIDRLRSEDSGPFFGWNGERIPW